MVDKKLREVYSNFSIEMQNAEAEIFVNGIYMNLMSEDIPSLLIHDSIYVPNHWVKDTEEIMTAHLDKAIGKDRYKIKHE